MMDVDPAAIEALLDRMDDDEDAERDDDLDAFFRHAWPSMDAQNG